MQNLIDNVTAAEEAVQNDDTLRALRLLADIKSSLTALQKTGQHLPHQLQVLDLPDIAETRVVDPSTGVEYHYNTTGWPVSVSVPA